MGVVSKAELAFRLWIEYRYLTYLRDRELPHTEHRMLGTPIVHPNYRAESTRYALQLRNRAESIQITANISDFEWERAREETDRYRHSLIARMYHAHTGNFYLDKRK